MNDRTTANCSRALVQGWTLILCVSAALGQDVPEGIVADGPSIPIVIAHRGASGYLPEHTTEAAAFAHALGVDYIEQDVVLTKDNVAVVLHDVTLDHVTDVAKVFPDRKRDGHFYVFDFTWSELRQLRVIERIRDPARNRFPADKGLFRICTLAEQIELIQGLNSSRKTQTGLYVEIKQPAMHRENGLDVSRRVLEVLMDYGYQSRDQPVFVQCFEEAEVRRLRQELKCQLSLIQLWGSSPSGEQLANAAAVADGIGVHWKTVVTGAHDGEVKLSNLVQQAHQRALQVHVWTFRTDELPDFATSATDMLTWLGVDAGVDGIFTDQPDTVLEWRRSLSNNVQARGPFRLLKGRDAEQQK